MYSDHVIRSHRSEYVVYHVNRVRHTQSKSFEYSNLEPVDCVVTTIRERRIDLDDPIRPDCDASLVCPMP
jgi:hypothetical protein